VPEREATGIRHKKDEDMEEDITVTDLMEAEKLVPGVLQCRAADGRENFSATLNKDGSIKDNKNGRFEGPIEWAKSLGHSKSEQAWDQVKIAGGYSLAKLREEYDSESQDEDGLEFEEEDGSVIRNPFDPEKIQVVSKSLLIAQLVLRMQNNEIDRPRFQRKAGIWDRERKSRLIESLLLRIPIPVFYFCADKKDDWSVVDGLQRTTSIYEFVSQQSFKLSGMEYLTHFNDMAFDDLPRPMQRRIEETQLSVNIIESGTPKEVTFNIFRRINTGGMQLTRQEIRQAIHSGEVLGYLRDLAESVEFVEATQGSIKPDRLADQECVLRFLAFYHRGWECYGTKDDLDPWLGETMDQINAMHDSQRRDLKLAFLEAMRIAQRLFGKYAFRKRRTIKDRKRPINKALFEAWSVGLARLSSEEQQSLVKRRQEVIKASLALMKQEDFDGAVSTSTGDYQRVQRRFAQVEALIKEILY